jgi:polyhydroxyalkanoate synthesis regulator phasin
MSSQLIQGNMNNNNILQFVQQGFRVTVGATASFLETIQDPQKRAEAISEMQTELTQKAGEWAQKGEITEQEARKIIEKLFRQQNWTKTSATSSTTSEVVYSPNNSTDNVESELQELTQQIIALRNELEQLRKSDNSQ